MHWPVVSAVIPGILSGLSEVGGWGYKDLAVNGTVRRVTLALVISLGSVMLPVESKMKRY